MKLRRKDGTTYTMSFDEFCARLWPFGKWCIVWEHITEGKHDGKKDSTKLDAVNSYIMHQSIGSSAMNVVGIKKKGGRFDGIEYKPATE